MPKNPALVWPNPAVYSGRSFSPMPREYPNPEYAGNGPFNVLVLLIEFQDVRHSSQNVPSVYDDRLFNTSSGVKSVRNYFIENSYGALNVTGQITVVWYLSDFNMDYYGGDGAGIDNANGPVYRLVTEAVNKSNPDIDFSIFDRDGDRYIDHLCVVHAGQGQESSTNKNCIWSHRWYDYDEPVADGVIAGPYTMLSEFSPMGVFAHEFGHDIGLPDLYDYGYDSFGAGVWDLMATGSWQDNGNTPVHLSAFCKMKMGWVSPVDIAGSTGNLSLPDIEFSPSAYRIWIQPPTEYFLIENRQRLGYDAFLPAGGLLVWHVDETKTNNDDQTHRMVDLEEADEALNGDSPVQSSDPWHDSSDGFNPSSVPNSDGYDGHKTGWWVFSIGPADNEMMFSARTVDIDMALTAVDYKLFTPEKVAHTISAMVYNVGSKTQTDVPVSCTILRENVVFSETKLIPALDIGRGARVQWSWTPKVLGNYVLVTRVSASNDAVSANDEKIGIIRVCALLFFDDVEQGNRGFDSGANVPLLPDLWHIQNRTDQYGDAFSPSHSWWAGFNATGQYRRGSSFIDYYLVSPIIDLTRVEQAVLSFYTRHDISSGLPLGLGLTADHGYIEVSSNLGSTWTRVDALSGNNGNWTLQAYDVSNFTRSMFQFRFVLSSNMLLLGRGWWVDDLAVYGVGDVYDVGLAFSPNITSALPGQSVNFNLSIVNAGNREDRFELSSSAPASVSLWLERSSIPLPLFGSTRVRVTATINGNAPAGTLVTFTISATSGGNFRVTRTAGASVIALQQFAVSLECAGPVLHSDPGANATFLVNVTNLGNGADVVKLCATGRMAPSAFVETETLQLQAWQMSQVNVRLTVAPNAPASAELQFCLTARSASGYTETISLKVIVNRTRGVSLIAEQASLDVQPGQKARFAITLKNLGNSKEDFILSSELPRFWQALHDVVIPLGPFSEVGFTLEVSSDVDSAGGANTVVLSTSAAGAEPGSVKLTVNIVLPDIALTGLKLSPQLADEGESVSLLVYLRNDGTATANGVTVYIYDNGRKVKEIPFDRLKKGDTEAVQLSLKFSRGRHIVSVAAAMADRELSSTNNAVQGEVRVQASSTFIPGFGALAWVAAVAPAIALALYGRKRQV